MSTSQGAVAVLCDWEGNRRSGVALAMRHRLCDKLYPFNLYPPAGSMAQGKDMTTPRTLL